MSQANNVVLVEHFDVPSSKSLDPIDSSKIDSHEPLGTIDAKDLELRMLGQSVTTLKADNLLLETELSNLKEDACF